jgi:hypothetical protein
MLVLVLSQRKKDSHDRLFQLHLSLLQRVLSAACHHEQPLSDAGRPRPSTQRLGPAGLRYGDVHCSEGYQASSVRDFEISTGLSFAVVLGNRRLLTRLLSQAQSHCREACHHTRHCKRARGCDDGHVLVLLGPAHLVPPEFWEAARVLLEPNCSAGAESPCCQQVPVVTTVPVTQVQLVSATVACCALWCEGDT